MNNWPDLVEVDNLLESSCSLCQTAHFNDRNKRSEILMKWDASKTWSQPSELVIFLRKLLLLCYFCLFTSSTYYGISSFPFCDTNTLRFPNHLLCSGSSRFPIWDQRCWRTLHMWGGHVKGNVLFLEMAWNGCLPVTMGSCWLNPHASLTCTPWQGGSQRIGVGGRKWGAHCRLVSLQGLTLLHCWLLFDISDTK